MEHQLHVLHAPHSHRAPPWVLSALRNELWRWMVLEALLCHLLQLHKMSLWSLRYLP